MYFSKFPTIYYNFPTRKGGNLLVVKDIALNVRFVTEVINNIQFYTKYVIQDGDTPETVAKKLYGREDYHWIVMLFNQRYDYINDWVRSETELLTYCTYKYGAGNEYEQHHIYGNPHWEVDDVYGIPRVFYNIDPTTGEDISNQTPFARSISNWDYESMQNELKREIKVLDARLVPQLVSEFASGFEVK